MKFKFLIALGVAGLLLVQLVHFSQHVLQIWEWLNGFKNMPFFTQFTQEVVWKLGYFLVPGEESYHRVFELGAALLHLLGNVLFFIAILGLFFFNRSKLVLWALVIQGVHLYEHASLFLSTYYIHQAIGMSTLFGYFQPYGSDLYDRQALTAFRVWWHFVANLIPTSLVLWALWPWLKTRVRLLRKS